MFNRNGRCAVIERLICTCRLRSEERREKAGSKRLLRSNNLATGTINREGTVTTREFGDLVLYGSAVFKRLRSLTSSSLVLFVTSVYSNNQPVHHQQYQCHNLTKYLYFERVLTDS